MDLADSCEYTVTTFTSDVRGAGTDANVFIELEGELGGEARHVGRQRLETGADNFERGRQVRPVGQAHTKLPVKAPTACVQKARLDVRAANVLVVQDIFKVRAADVGAVRKVTLSHDNSGLGASWHVTLVTVHSSTTGATYSFPCNAWLIKDREHPEGNVKELLEGATASGDVGYSLDVVTSDVRGAGTDGAVSVTLFGASGDTGVPPQVIAAFVPGLVLLSLMGARTEGDTWASSW